MAAEIEAASSGIPIPGGYIRFSGRKGQPQHSDDATSINGVGADGQSTTALLASSSDVETDGPGLQLKGGDRI